MDPDVARLTQDVPNMPTVILWAAAYIGNTLALVSIAGILSWILRKTTGWVTTIFTCHLLAGGAIALLTSWILIPSGLLGFQRLLPGIHIFQIPLGYIGMGLLLVGCARLLFLDIPHRIQSARRKNKNAQTPPKIKDD